MEHGKFIVLEGIDGSGTTTQGPLLVKYLFEKMKRNVPVLTREPTELSPHGKELRRRLEGKLLPGEEVIHDPAYWASLFFNDRKWHVDKVISPSIGIGLQVISDRYKLSTIAYQSAQGIGMDELIKMHEGLPIPDLTLLLDVSAEIALARRGKDQHRTQEYFEGLETQRKVRNQYLLAAQNLSSSEKIVIIDASQTVEQVAAQIQQEVNKLYGYE